MSKSKKNKTPRIDPRTLLRPRLDALQPPAQLQPAPSMPKAGLPLGMRDGLTRLRAAGTPWRPGQCPSWTVDRFLRKSAGSVLTFAKSVVDY